jgi:hypothetical protein
MVESRRRFNSAFSVEITHVKAFMNEYPLLTLGLLFFLGLIVDGILRSTASQFVIITLLGGFSLARLYGLSIGLPAYVSIPLAVPVDLFTCYAMARMLWAIESYPRAVRYLTKLKERYGPGADFLAAHAGRIGVGGALALCTLLIGWEVAVVISYLLDMSVKTAMKSIVLGELIGAGVSWASYEGLANWLPNPLVVTAILLITFALIARVIGIMAKREAANKPLCS